MCHWTGSQAAPATVPTSVKRLFLREGGAHDPALAHGRLRTQRGSPPTGSFSKNTHAYPDRGARSSILAERTQQMDGTRT